jgi:hypothetical protein
MTADRIMQTAVWALRLMVNMTVSSGLSLLCPLLLRG